MLFLGTVRELTDGRRTVALDYEAYGPMAEAKLNGTGNGSPRTLADRPASQLSTASAELELGEVSVAVAVELSAPERSVRGGPLPDRQTQGDRPNLEKRKLERRHDRMGASRSGPAAESK